MQDGYFIGIRLHESLAAPAPRTSAKSETLPNHRLEKVR